MEVKLFNKVYDCIIFQLHCKWNIGTNTFKQTIHFSIYTDVFIQITLKNRAQPFVCVNKVIFVLK